MSIRTYCVWFVDVDIKIFVDAVLGEIAVSKAEKQLEGKELGNKVNFWEVLSNEALSTH